jgi:hypothetical protein
MKRHARSLLSTAVLALGCAVSSTAQAWDAESVNVEAKSTHLWIVDNAINLLAQRADLPRATSFVEALNAPACRTNWQQGLLDADFLAIYNNGDFNTQPGDSTAELVGSGATWKSHFYDPDSNENYKGETSPTARTQAALFLASATSSWATNQATACYQLGLSFHYMTDTTQPMHASNFTADDRAVELHTDFETYALTIQTRYLVTDASFLSTSETPDAALIAAAHASKALWPALLQAFYTAYENNGDVCYVEYETWLEDRPSCWEGNSGLDAQTGIALQGAQQSAANYLYAVATSFTW